MKVSKNWSISLLSLLLIASTVCGQEDKARMEAIEKILRYEGYYPEKPYTPIDYKEVVKSLRKTAEQGNPEAQHNLGYMYYFGRGVPLDYKEGVKWFRKAAEQGDAVAQFNLGNLYYFGQGSPVPQDYKEAVKWYRKAAEQGYSDAQYNLGYMYYYGQGVPLDYVQAYAWLNVSVATEANEKRTKARSVLIEQMTPEQIGEGHKLSRELFERIENGKKEDKVE